MPDISMCSNRTCGVRETCYRYRAIPKEFRQSYLVIEGDLPDGCDHFWPLNELVTRARPMSEIEPTQASGEGK